MHWRRRRGSALCSIPFTGLWPRPNPTHTSNDKRVAQSCVGSSRRVSRRTRRLFTAPRERKTVGAGATDGSGGVQDIDFMTTAELQALTAALRSGSWFSPPLHSTLPALSPTSITALQASSPGSRRISVRDSGPFCWTLPFRVFIHRMAAVGWVVGASAACRKVACSLVCICNSSALDAMSVCDACW